MSRNEQKPAIALWNETRKAYSRFQKSVPYELKSKFDETYEIFSKTSQFDKIKNHFWLNVSLISHYIILIERHIFNVKHVFYLYFKRNLWKFNV
jgi:hypothetical protein